MGKKIVLTVMVLILGVHSACGTCYSQQMLSPALSLSQEVVQDCFFEKGSVALNKGYLSEEQFNREFGPIFDKIKAEEEFIFKTVEKIKQRIISIKSDRFSIKELADIYEDFKAKMETQSLTESQREYIMKRFAEACLRERYDWGLYSYEPVEKLPRFLLSASLMYASIMTKIDLFETDFSWFALTDNEDNKLEDFCRYFKLDPIHQQIAGEDIFVFMSLGRDKVKSRVFHDAVIEFFNKKKEDFQYVRDDPQKEKGIFFTEQGSILATAENVSLFSRDFFEKQNNVAKTDMTLDQREYVDDSRVKEFAVKDIQGNDVVLVSKRINTRNVDTVTYEIDRAKKIKKVLEKISFKEEVDVDVQEFVGIVYDKGNFYLLSRKENAVDLSQFLSSEIPVPALRTFNYLEEVFKDELPDFERRNVLLEQGVDGSLRLILIDFERVPSSFAEAAMLIKKISPLENNIIRIDEAI